MANFNLPRLRSGQYPIIIFSYLVIFMAASWLRLSYLSVPSLWQDEAHSWWIARLDWGNFFGALRSIGVHPPLYFFLLKGVIALFGESEFALRILSTFADLAALIFGLVLGYLVAGWIGSIIAGWFIAFQPMSVWYSGEARPYALALFFAGLALLLFICLKRKPNSALYWVLAIFAISLGLLTHFFFFLVWASLIFWYYLI